MFTEICEVIDSLMGKQNILTVAIDGRCGSGKTTLGNRLSAHYGCTLLHMDDFYLRAEQRTAERLATPGGNVDHERFIEEVLIPLTERRDFLLRPFDHSTFQPGDGRLIHPTPLVIIEGSYSCNKHLRNFYDLRIFLTTGLETQLERITQRSSKEKAQEFVERWIPLEERYFSTLDTEHIFELRYKT